MDDKYDELIDDIRKKEPSEFQMKKWKKAVSEANSQTVAVERPLPKKYYWAQMVAAVFIGIVIGGLLFNDFNLSVSEKNTEIAYEDATIEVVYTKL